MCICIRVTAAHHLDIHAHTHIHTHTHKHTHTHAIRQQPWYAVPKKAIAASPYSVFRTLTTLAKTALLLQLISSRRP